MKLVTRRDKILSVVEQWKENFPESTNLLEGKNSGEILRQLKKLDLRTCLEKAITEIIGNNSWTSLWCHICNTHISGDFVIQVVESKSYSKGDGFCICETCAQEIIKLYQEGKLEKYASSSKL